MNDRIYCCRIEEESENRNVIFEFLAALELQFSSWTDMEKHLNYHMIYTDSEEDAGSVSHSISSHSVEWKSFGIEIRDIQVVSFKQEDWSEVWKEFFKVERVSEQLVIKPSWRDYKPIAGELVIEIDPGMSFGTGRHATTRFCLKMLSQIATKLPLPLSFLDAGCGSGILSIGAHKLGFRPLLAFDIDESAVKISRENIALNGINAGEIRLETADLNNIRAFNRRFDVVAANILAPVLIENSGHLLDLLAADGYLILAGILENEYGEVRRYFTNLGLSELESLVEDEWQGGLFRRT